jgi:outer membrane PBP1 activator LpoA protein
MNIAQQLDALQALDLDLDRLRGQLATVQASQSEPPTIQAARDALAHADLLLTKRRKAAQDREWDVRDGQAKVNNVESRRNWPACFAMWSHRKPTCPLCRIVPWRP